MVDLYDRPAVVSLLSDADGAIHTASPGDETSADLDSAVVDAAIEAFAGTGKPYLHITGAWVYGANTSITEESPIDAPAMVSWKEPIARRVLDATDMRGVVIAPGVAYGDGGGGVPGLLLGSPRDDAGNLIMLGTGQQHWSTVHVADLADFFRRALEDDSARGHYVVGDGLNPTVAELTEAAAVAAGAPGAVPGSDDEARARLGDYFAEVLLLDQGTDAAKARAELDWSPSHPGLVDEFRKRELPQEPRDRGTDNVTRGGRGPAGDPELVDAYAHCADRRDADGQKALFTEDTHFVVYMDGEGTEPDAGTQWPRGADAGVRRPQQVRGDDAFQRPEHDRARWRPSDRRELLPGPPPVHEGGERKLMVASLRYLDAFLKRDSAWLFAERRLYVDWTETRPSQPQT